MAEKSDDKDLLDDEEKRYLLKLARDSIESYLRDGKIIQPKTDDVRLKEFAGAFVTLEEFGQLRGCIGYISAIQPLYLAVRDNAVNAAVEDPRFPRVMIEEMKDIEIEISVLTAPKPLEAASPKECLEKIRPGKDGLILEHRGRSATYLPQVWEQIPEKEEFMGSLCNKAGLGSGAWKEKGAKIFCYGVQAFKESEYK